MPMNEPLTTAEIEARFPSEWVLIGDPRIDKVQRVLGGIVLWHTKDRDELYRKAMELSPKFFATLYTGTTPKGTAIVL
jgi:hypothetical protein